MNNPKYEKDIQLSQVILSKKLWIFDPREKNNLIIYTNFEWKSDITDITSPRYSFVMNNKNREGGLLYYWEYSLTTNKARLELHHVNNQRILRLSSEDSILKDTYFFHYIKAQALFNTLKQLQDPHTTELSKNIDFPIEIQVDYVQNAINNLKSSIPQLKDESYSAITEFYYDNFFKDFVTENLKKHFLMENL